MCVVVCVCCDEKEEEVVVHLYSLEKRKGDIRRGSAESRE